MAALPSRPTPAAKEVPSGSPTDRARALLAVMTRLSDLMIGELEAVRCGALDRVAGLQAEKRALATKLDETGRLLRLDRTGLAGLPPEVRRALDETGRRLAAITMASAETLDIQGRAQKCVVDVAVKTVEQDRRAGIAYAQGRKGISGAGRRAPPAGSSTFSATL